MSHRPLEKKKLRKLRKALRRTPPAYIDLVEYIKDRSRCSSKTAIKAIASGAVKSDSHVLRNRYVPASLRGSITFDTEVNRANA